MHTNNVCNDRWWFFNVTERVYAIDSPLLDQQSVHALDRALMRCHPSASICTAWAEGTVCWSHDRPDASMIFYILFGLDGLRKARSSWNAFAPSSTVNCHIVTHRFRFVVSIVLKYILCNRSVNDLPVSRPSSFWNNKIIRTWESNNTVLHSRHNSIPLRPAEQAK